MMNQYKHREKGVDEFLCKCSRRPQLQPPEQRQEQGWVKDKVESSAKIYQRNHYQPEREMVPWIPQYDSDEQQHQNYFN